MMVATLERAIELAAKHHEGQTDKGGNPYILHLLRVMMSMETNEQRIVAVLHNIIEDTNVMVEDLHQEGFSDDVVEAIQVLTRKSDEIYMGFIRRCKTNSLARVVKRADLKDNMDLSRINNPNDDDYKRKDRYFKTLIALIEQD